jgi:hypothetical protein
MDTAVDVAPSSLTSHRLSVHDKWRALALTVPKFYVHKHWPLAISIERGGKRERKATFANDVNG